jgi:hypothetical protein
LTRQTKLEVKDEEEHDIRTGLRDHFDAKSKWRSVLTGVMAANRFGGLGSRSSTRSSGGWLEDKEGEARGSNERAAPVSSENANVTVTPPTDDVDPGGGRGGGGDTGPDSKWFFGADHALKGKNTPPPIFTDVGQELNGPPQPAIVAEEPLSALTPEQQQADEAAMREKEEFKMPGSFHWFEEDFAPAPPKPNMAGSPEPQRLTAGGSRDGSPSLRESPSWSDLFKRLRLSG